MQLIKKFVKKNLLLNKKRSIVTIIGIILSIALLSSLTTLVSSFRTSLITFEKNKSGDYHVSFQNVAQKDLSIFDKNRMIESYFTTSDLGVARIEESKNEDKPYCRIIGLNKEGLKHASITLVSGRLPENSNEIAIPRHLKTNGRVEYNVGENLTLNVGKRIDLGTKDELSPSISFTGFDAEEITDTASKTYKIVGIIERPIFAIESFECPEYSFVTYLDERVGNVSLYARLTKQGLKDSNKVVSGILGVNYELFNKFNSDEVVDLTEKEHMQYMKEMSNVKYQFDINHWLISYERLWPIDSSYMAIFILAVIVALIIIGTSIYCIKNSFTISTNEKIRQYGMFASIGATKKQIKKCVHLEAFFLGCIGIPLGLISGIFASYVLIALCNNILGEMLGITLSFNPSIIALVISVLLGIVTIYFSALGSARKAAKVSPIDAIRNSNEITLNKKKIKAPKYIHKLWGIGGVISYKNIKRNKKKYRTTVVSIAFCTITFIVTSYFLSMGVDLVGMNYSQDTFNLSMTTDYINEEDFDISTLKNFDNIKEINISSIVPVSADNCPLTKEYTDYYSKAYDSNEPFVTLRIVALESDSFKKYEKDCGYSDSNGKKIILTNNIVQEWTSNGKIRKGEFDVFDISAGDTLNISIEKEIGYDEEKDEFKYDKINYSIPIDKITTHKPIGYNAGIECNYIFMSIDKAKELNIELGNHYTTYIESSNTDKLQDDLEVMFDTVDKEGFDYSIYNRDKNAKTEKSFFLLIEIFAYGLISVIALIGITNIINTLSTSMELRSREFATLRSVGMTDKEFSRMVRLESIFTSSKALVVGVTIGMLISLAINRLECTYDVIIPFRPPIAASLIAVAVATALIYTVIRLSMNKIMKKNIIETIKNENL